MSAVLELLGGVVEMVAGLWEAIRDDREVDGEGAPG